MILQKGDKLVMIGDSITDAGRARPAGEGRGDAIGRGYVAIVNALLGAVYPELGVRVINRGNSGNTVRDLKDRWQEDVLDLKPDWLSIMIGINDVWRQFDLPRISEMHVHQFEYEKTLDDLIAQAKQAVKNKVIIMTPYILEANIKDGMRVRMDEYGLTCKALAEKHDAIFIDTQAAIDKVLEHVHPMSLAWDRIHPDMTGHAILARAFLDGVGFEWCGKSEQ